MTSLHALFLSLALCVSGADSHTETRSDDVNVQSLQTVVQQQATLLDRQTAQLTALQTQVSSMAAQLSSLKLWQQKQAAFSVTFSGSQHALNIGANAAIKFDRVITNAGDGYKPQTGQFSAPHAGLYTFFLGLRSDNAHTWLTVGIYRGSTLLIEATADGSADPYDKGYAYVTTHLQRGETVYARHVGGDTYLESSILTTFSGTLIHAD